MNDFYICNDCGGIFNEDEFGCKREEIDCIDGYRYFQTWKCCPHCSSEDYSEAVDCWSCGEIVSQDKSVDGICKACAKKLISRFDDIVDKHFNGDEIEWLVENWTWEGYCDEN